MTVAASNQDGNAKSRLYAFEVPPLEAGDYVIITKQSVEAPTKKQTEQIVSEQPVTVKASQPYTLSQDLIHSYHPPNMRTVSPRVLPHVILKGATPWERSKGFESGKAPTPWLALLLFTDDELCVPPEVVTPAIRPSGTKAITLPLDLFNSYRLKFCHQVNLPAPSKPDGTPGTADFIFLKSEAFKMFFERQDSSSRIGVQKTPELDRYKLLTLMTDTGVDDGTGHRNAKLSTLIGHRTRPYKFAAGEQKVHAHVVSIEDLETQISWDAAKSASATIALASLMSWTFTWQDFQSQESVEMFRNLSDSSRLRPLEIKMTDPKKDYDQSDPSLKWVKSRIKEGYTIVRHRDIAGETAMALYRGPLMPRMTHKARIRPSIHGSDLQIIDSYAKVIDVSYCTAWELGRSLAGRDAKFSSTIASLRRKVYMKAVAKSIDDATDSTTTVMNKPTEVVGSVLSKLDELFQDSHLPKPTALPHESTVLNKALRWNVPTNNATSLASAPGIMTQAKLRRHLKKSAEGWLDKETKKVLNSNLKELEAWQLPIVFDWLINNLMSLKLVPATYLFPDPAVIANDSINCFIIDDVWVDALVDGAMSIANTMGGGDDPVREQIRKAFNLYLKGSQPDTVPIGGSGFVLKSGVVESFPDLEINITASSPGNPPLKCAYRSKNDDMILCLVGRGNQQRLVDYKVQLKLPPHQQQFGLGDNRVDGMSFTCTLRPYITTDKPGGSSDDDLRREVSWTRSKDGKIQSGNPSYPPLWDWNTGVLSPHIIAQMMDDFLTNDKEKARVYGKPAADSRSIYMASQLIDPERSIILNFNVTKDDKGNPRETPVRELFPSHEAVEDNTREEALFHDPQLEEILDQSAGKSWFTKQAFSQEAPGRNIPAQSNTTQHLVFSVKVRKETTPPLPTDLEVASLEFKIPLGEETCHLLDHMAPLPMVKAIGTKQQWVATIRHKKSDAFIVVHLLPRGARGATLQKGLDASFVLTGSTVNGVMGDDVNITVKETYVRKRLVAGKKEPEIDTMLIRDSWFLAKE